MDSAAQAVALYLAKLPSSLDSTRELSLWMKCSAVRGGNPSRLTWRAAEAHLWTRELDHEYVVPIEPSAT